MENFVYEKVNINYNVNNEGWITDYNTEITEPLAQWEYEEVVKSSAIRELLSIKENFTDELLLNILNEFVISYRIASESITKSICRHKRSIPFLKNVFNILKSMDAYRPITFLKQYINYGYIDKELLDEFKNDIINNLSYFNISKDNFCNYMIPFINENIGQFLDKKLELFLYINMDSFDFDYNEIKRLLPTFEDKYILYLTNNMPKAIANSLLENDMMQDDHNNHLYTAYFKKNPDNAFITNNIEEIIKIYGARCVQDYSLIFKEFVYQSDYVFKELFPQYKIYIMFNEKEITDISIYEKYVNLLNIHHTTLEDMQICFNDRIFECHKRMVKIVTMYTNEIENMKSILKGTYSDVFFIQNRESIIDNVNKLLIDVQENFEADKKECLDILKNDQYYFLIDKKIKTHEFNKCKLSSKKFEEDINVFYTKNNSYEKQCTLKEFLEELFNIEINFKKKSYIPENMVKEFTEDLFRGEITNNKDCLYILKIDIDLSQADLIEYILSYKISADNKKSLSTKTLQDFLALN